MKIKEEFKCCSVAMSAVLTRIANRCYHNKMRGKNLQMKSTRYCSVGLFLDHLVSSKNLKRERMNAEECGKRNIRFRAR